MTTNFSLLTTLKKGLLQGATSGALVGAGASMAVPALNFASKEAIYASVGGAVLGFVFKVVKNVLKQKYGISIT